MRKMVVELRPDPRTMEALGDPFSIIDSLSVVELLGMDPKLGLRLAVIDLSLLKDAALKDVPLPPGMRIVEVLEKKGPAYRALVSFDPHDPSLNIVPPFHPDLIWTTPIYKSRSRVVLSCMGDREQLQGMLEIIRTMGEAVSVRFLAPHNRGDALVSRLTGRQKEVMLEAARMGYYEYPRRADAGGIALKVGLSKATVVEHLRKGEIRLLSDLLTGQM
mgnify:CR=1 FL=1